MDYRLRLPKPWRYRDQRRGIRQLAAGTYDVPEQLTPRAAELALAQGVATKEEKPKPVTVVVDNRAAAAPDVAELSEHMTTAIQRAATGHDRGLLPQTPKRRGRRKKPAPENKSIGPAAENKQPDLLDDTQNLER